MAGDRRRHARVPALFEVAWEGAAGRYEARTSDLSEGGCFIDTIVPAAVGQEITFRLRLPAGGWVELQGVVTYHFPNTGFGVRFESASAVDRKRLEWLVKAEGRKAGKGP
jgi:uncharacterized protein (TIGR02266 family)